MEKQKRPRHATSPDDNRIHLPFEKAVEGLLAVKPKKVPKSKKKPSK